MSPPALARHVYSILFDGRRPGRVYAGSYFDIEPGYYGYPFGGALFVSEDSGVSFSKIGLDFGAPVQAVVADPTQDGALYAVTAGERRVPQRRRRRALGTSGSPGCGQSVI